MVLPIIVLLLLAGLAGSRVEKKGFWALVGLLVLVFLGFVYAWQYTRSWPGFFNPAFAAEVGKWALAVLVGSMVGGIVFGGAPKRENL